MTSGNVLWRQVTSSSALLASFLTVSNSNSNVTSSNVLLTSMTSSNALLASFVAVSDSNASFSSIIKIMS